MTIELPISKSIANRVLIRKALRGEDVQSFTDAAFPEDVRLMARCLSNFSNPSNLFEPREAHLNLDNCGTAMRFLTAYFAQKEGADVILDGCERMHHRPIGQEVDALRQLGADIEYLGADGFPPLHIRGHHLSLNPEPLTLNQPASTQFVSALLLIGADVQTDSTSPYIEMTRAIVAGREEMEPDWSAAAFWLERHTLGLCPELEFTFHSLPTGESRRGSLQGDAIAPQIFAQIEALKNSPFKGEKERVSLDCSYFPDLVPAIAVACRLLHLDVTLTGTESLRIKESDRLEALEENFRRIERKEFPLRSYGDHRIAMAFMAAGFDVDDTDCIRKSYPRFVEQLLQFTRVIPTRATGLPKKQALRQGIAAAQTPWVWLNDDDVSLPSTAPARLPDADLIILPMRMQARGDSLLEHLQLIEYAAIQELTVRSAQKGRAVMCSGANLVVRREAWLESWVDLHPEIPSGDDMFLLESFKHRGRTIAVLDGYEATCFAEPTLRGLLRQRARWAGKTPFLRDRDIRLCGAWTLLSNLLVVLCPVWLLIKWVADTCFLRKRLKRWTQKKNVRALWLKTLLLTVIYPWYMLLCLVSGIRHIQRW